MLVLSWMVCNVRLSTNNGCSSDKEGGSVSKRYHELPVLAIQRLDWQFIIIALGRVEGLGSGSECILPSPMSNWEYQIALLPVLVGDGDYLTFIHLKQTGFLQLSFIRLAMVKDWRLSLPFWVFP